MSANPAERRNDEFTRLDHYAEAPELTGWLGVAAEDMSEEQRAEFGRLVRAYQGTREGRDGEPADYAEEDTAAWVAAYEQAVGELDVTARGVAYREAQRAAYAGAMIAALAGTSEVQAAREATIQRSTLRELLGKDMYRRGKGKAT